MKISHRLYLTLFPSVVGITLMIGLAYYGQFARQAAHAMLIIGSIVVVASFALTWSNARFVARRVERLVEGHVPTTLVAGHLSLRGVGSAVAPDSVGDQPDELDQIESVVERLSTAVEVAEKGRVERERVFEERVRDYARLLAGLADATSRRLDEVRLPIHILLDNHFGELNENQEELLGAARASAESAEADMRSLRQIAELDLGVNPLRRDRMKPVAIIEAIRPMLVAAAESAEVVLEVDLAPLLPAITGDRAHLQEALVTLFRGAIASAAPESGIRVEGEADGPWLRLSILNGGEVPMSVAWGVAVRVVQVHGGVVEREAHALRVLLPIEGR